MTNIWCVAYIQRDERGAVQRDAAGEIVLGWCATKSGKGFRSGTNSVTTKCDYFIILPCGKKKRRPTCPDCVRALAN